MNDRLADDYVPEAWRDKPEGWRKHVAECDDCNVRYGDKSLAKVTVRRADLVGVLELATETANRRGLLHTSIDNVLAALEGK